MNVQWLLDFGGDEREGLADRVDALEIAFGNLDAELLLECHHQLDQVEAVGVEVVAELRLGHDGGLVDGEHLDGALLEAGEKFGMSALDVSAALQAMSELQRLRLNHQHHAITTGIKPDNHLHPEELSTYDEAVLREGLKQAKRLQQRLKLTYRI